ncbi:DNA polymerase III subunit delta [Mycoplasmopsis agassizii]|uniref:DNA polymerase III subunit delta n=1 Tax=Mycoplasmopsis agassizii TaxID=33922 RepID=UPI003529A9F0
MYNKNMIIFTGEDEFLVNEKVNKLLTEKYNQYNLTVHSLDIDLDYLFNEITQSDLFSEKKIFWLKSPTFLQSKIIKDSDYSKLLTIIKYKQYPLIISAPFMTSENKLHTYLKKNFKVENIKKLEGFELNKYIYDYAKANGIDLDHKMINHIVTVLPNEMQIIVNEISKLRFINKKITYEMIDDFFSSYAKDPGFSFVNSLSTNDKKEIFSTFKKELTYNSEAVELVGKISNILITSIELDNAILSEGSFSKAVASLKLNEYRGKKIYEFLKFRGRKKIESLIKELDKVDFQIKNTKIAPEIILEAFVLKIFKDEHE